MTKNIFFKKKNIKLKSLYPNLKTKKNFTILNIKPLHSAGKDEISFFESVKYKEIASNTKASACITTEKISKFLPKTTDKIIVKMFYLN